ncbi:MAG: hypothetical protein K0U37_05010 [Gammaproteobacteria bacterium]|nr:hypothetical protein [Gammaproteobacteria bacterium]
MTKATGSFTQDYEDWAKEYGYSGVFSNVLSGLGALGVALQNYQAVELFLKAVTTWSTGFIQAMALGAGGACSGMVNLWMNMDLLDKFFTRMMSDKAYQYKKLTAWQQLQYFGGIFVFFVTGVLFGLMAFTFAMEGPLAMLSIAVGVFVAAIMTIQEIETWLSSYDEKEVTEAESLTALQKIGKWCGHIIAVGNVIALSLLFTLSLAEALMVLHLAVIPALGIGAAVAFTFGAFTEYYFYNFYLADFCKDFGDNWSLMMEAPHAFMGFMCVFTNAFVNAALTYSALELLTALLITAEVALPPVAIITALSLVSAFFAGSASFILGMDFWIGSKPAEPEIKAESGNVSIAKSRHGLFASNHKMDINDATEEVANAKDLELGMAA